METHVSYPHISIGKEGVARIGNTRYKVLHLAAEHFHNGWSAEELLRQHPDLRPEQVYAALTYFYDHHEELVNEMREHAEEAEKYRFNQTLSRSELLARKKESA